MQGTSYHDMAELLRQAALQEAASRAKTRSPLNTDPTASTSLISKVTAEAEVEAEELFAVYEDEKAKNDALARTIDERMEALANAKSSKADQAVKDEKKKLEIEWQQLEFAIRQLEEEKRHLPELDSSAVLDLRTRAELHDLNLQYSSALSSLRSDLASERDALSRETQLHSDLDIVSAGLSKRLAQLQRRRRQDLTSESSIRYVFVQHHLLFSITDESILLGLAANSELNRKFKREEQRFKELLAQLIDMGTSLFGSDNRKVVTLRHYLDEFMNQAWDKPLDPWVSSTKLAMRRTGGEVDDAMIEFFVRANIIVPHPKDSRRWRLVGFHKPTRG